MKETAFAAIENQGTRAGSALVNPVGRTTLPNVQHPRRKH